MLYKSRFSTTCVPDNPEKVARANMHVRFVKRVRSKRRRRIIDVRKFLANNFPLFSLYNCFPFLFHQINCLFIAVLQNARCDFLSSIAISRRQPACCQHTTNFYRKRQRQTVFLQFFRVTKHLSRLALRHDFARVHYDCSIGKQRFFREMSDKQYRYILFFV